MNTAEHHEMVMKAADEAAEQRAALTEAGEDVRKNEAWVDVERELERSLHKRLQSCAKTLMAAAQPNAMKPGELRKFVTDVAMTLHDVAVDVAFMTPRKSD